MKWIHFNLLICSKNNVNISCKRYINIQVASFVSKIVKLRVDISNYFHILTLMQTITSKKIQLHIWLGILTGQYPSPKLIGYLFESGNNQVECLFSQQNLNHHSRPNSKLRLSSNKINFKLKSDKTTRSCKCSP